MRGNGARQETEAWLPSPRGRQGAPAGGGGGAGAPATPGGLLWHLPQALGPHGVRHTVWTGSGVRVPLPLCPPSFVREKHF